MDDVLTSFNQTCSPNMLAQTMLGKPTAAGDAALEDKFWREVPQQLWDKLVLKDGTFMTLSPLLVTLRIVVPYVISVLTLSPRFMNKMIRHSR